MQVGIKLASELPAGSEAALGGLIHVRGGQLTSTDARTTKWQHLFTLLRNLGAQVEGVRFSPGGGWLTPTAEMIGGVLSLPHQSASNPIDEYDPMLPEPCRGFLPWELPLEVGRVPEHPVAVVGQDLVGTPAIAEELGADTAPVTLGGLPNDGLVRLRPRERHKTLDPTSFIVGSCGLCRAERLQQRLLIGRPAGTEPTGWTFDLLGAGHLGRELLVVVGARQSHDLERKYGGKYSRFRVQPIWAHDGPTATLTHDIERMAAQLMADV